MSRFVLTDVLVTVAGIDAGGYTNVQLELNADLMQTVTLCPSATLRNP